MPANPSNEAEYNQALAARLYSLGTQQQERLARRRAEELKLPYINLSMWPVDPDVLEKIPKQIAEKAEAVLFYKQGKDIRVGVVNPTLPGVAEVDAIVKGLYNMEPQHFIISSRSLAVSLGRYRRDKAYAAQAQGQLNVEQKQVEGFDQALSDLTKLGQHLATLPPTEIINVLVAGAVKWEASDLHIEPKAIEARLRYRVDGVLQDITTIPRGAWQLVLSRVKVLSSLKLNVHDVPQDGSFVLNIGDEIFDIRVSLLPGGDGENIVMRLLNRKAEAVKVTDLGMKQRDYDVVMSQLKLSDGLILVTGPTGSGKTTSLAAFLMEINSPEFKIITLEDPIEYRLPGVEQTEVNESAGYTFAIGLRAILRQDPDVVLVGEIRDTETAETALHASMTGHLVFSTLHTNDSPGAIVRLLDMGAQPFVLAPSINLVIAQRLVRVVCPKCGESYTPDPAVREHIREGMRGVVPEVFDPKTLDDPKLTLKKAKGCDECHQTGYKGRVGIFEVMLVAGEVEDLILRGADGNTIKEAAIKAGMTTIPQDGFMKVLAGITTMEEIERVTGE